jgi:hypothetical protein
MVVYQCPGCGHTVPVSATQAWPPTTPCPWCGVYTYRQFWTRNAPDTKRVCETCGGVVRGANFCPACNNGDDS